MSERIDTWLEQLRHRGQETLNIFTNERGHLNVVVDGVLMTSTEIRDLLSEPLADLVGEDGPLSESVSIADLKSKAAF
jgi:hypothetical protein